MSLIVPAILPQNRQELESKLLILAGSAHDVQIDCVDGKFIGPETWPYLKGKWIDDLFTGDVLPHADAFTFEADLMVENPGDVAGKWIDAGATRIVFHATSSPKVLDDIRRIQVRYGHEKSFASGLLSLGLALSSRADLAILPKFLPHIDFVQFMGIERIGVQGQPFDRRLIEKLRQFRKRYPDIPVQVDGGVSKESAPDLLALGVSRLIVGSALWKSADPRVAYQELTAMRTQFGRYE